MNHQDLIIETLRLEIATVAALVDLGCLQTYTDKMGPIEMEVPSEEAYFDPANRLIWLVIKPERLPRPYTCEMLLDNGLQDAIVARFGQCVEVQHVDQTLVIMNTVDQPLIFTMPREAEVEHITV